MGAVRTSVAFRPDNLLMCSSEIDGEKLSHALAVNNKPGEETRHKVHQLVIYHIIVSGSRRSGLILITSRSRYDEGPCQSFFSLLGGTQQVGWGTTPLD